MSRTARVGEWIQWFRRNPTSASLISIVAFLFFTGVVVFACFVITVRQSIAQRQALVAFQEMGGEYLCISWDSTELLGLVLEDDLLMEVSHLVFVEGNTLTNAGLEHLRGLKNLQHLSLAGTNISDNGLVHLTHLKHLNHLDLSNTKITNAGLRYIANLTELEELNLSGTHVTIDGLIHLRGFSHFRKLDVTATAITHADVVELYGPKGPRFFILY